MKIALLHTSYMYIKDWLKGTGVQCVPASVTSAYLYYISYMSIYSTIILVLYIFCINFEITNIDVMHDFGCWMIDSVNMHNH